MTPATDKENDGDGERIIKKISVSKQVSLPTDHQFRSLIAPEYVPREVDEDRFLNQANTDPDRLHLPVEQRLSKLSLPDLPNARNIQPPSYEEVALADLDGPPIIFPRRYGSSLYCGRARPRPRPTYLAVGSGRRKGGGTGLLAGPPTRSSLHSLQEIGSPPIELAASRQPVTVPLRRKSPPTQISNRAWCAENMSSSDHHQRQVEEPLLRR
uniref:Uncharacterized protein n=1 Tax=Plectus sambesii TaxID=2011161 RepID=A0A914VTK8_9BILA